MTTPHPPAGPTLAGWLQEQIKADQSEAAASHPDDCQVWEIAKQRDDDRAPYQSVWCEATCAARQALNEVGSKGLILGLALWQYESEDDADSRIGWLMMKHLAVAYHDRPGYLTVQPHGPYTRWCR